jgi:hypothetical protein
MFQPAQPLALLKRGQYPFSVYFLNWQESSVGKYIEFMIRVTFHEGAIPEDHPNFQQFDQSP